jgi:uncharacterized damage-inducible protein DinB
MDQVGTSFIDYSRRYLSREFMPRIRSAVERLSDEDVWWRPNAASNSIGNLLLHLAGNARQWIVSGVGGEEDIRRREQEFAATGGLTKEEALSRLERTISDVEATLSRVNPAVLLEERQIQGRRVTVLDAIYHVVEHFSMHTGQIVYIAKLRLGQDLGFYRLEDGIPRPQWEEKAPVPIAKQPAADVGAIP